MILHLTLASLLAGSGALAPAQDSKTPKVPDIVYVPDDDKEMNAAMESARKTLDEFIKVWKKRTAAQTEFAVKVAIRDGDKIEHFWVGVSKFDGKNFEGHIANEPGLVKNVKEGDLIAVAKAKVEDWMYVQKRKLNGGYTTKLLYKRLKPDERKALDASIPYKIE
jgi:uncharacterized protein YegJ (DUF2314 family)